MLIPAPTSAPSSQGGGSPGLRRLSTVSRITRHDVQHESSGELLRQCGHGELLRDREEEEAERFPSYSDAKMALFDYIEVFYNQRRRHSTIGQISPAAFERRTAAA